jgi:hypothetical protein
MEPEPDMSDEERLSAAGHRSRAAHFRTLAADATTLRARGYLTDMADQCDARAARLAVATALLDTVEYDRPARWGRAR